MNATKYHVEHPAWARANQNHQIAQGSDHQANGNRRSHDANPKSGESRTYGAQRRAPHFLLKNVMSRVPKSR
jgi:hypothetical protein